jgi:hypothetical protein
MKSFLRSIGTIRYILSDIEDLAILNRPSRVSDEVRR